MNDPRVPALHRTATVLMALYLVVLAAAVFLPLPFAQVPRGTGPEWDLELAAPDLLGGWETRRNVLMTIPFGVLLPLVVRWRYEALVLACVALTLTIETVQLLVSVAVGWAWRAFDVSDLLLNTIGGVLGLALTGTVLLATRRTAVPPVRRLAPGAAAAAVVVWSVASTVAAARPGPPVVDACAEAPAGVVTTLPGGAGAYAGSDGSLCLQVDGGTSSLPLDATGPAMTYERPDGTWVLGTSRPGDPLPQVGGADVELYAVEGSPALVWASRRSA